MQDAATPHVTVLTPNEDATLTLLLTVSNGLASASAPVAVRVEGLQAAWGLEAATGEAHNSHLTVASTSLRPGFIFGRTDQDLVISFQTDDGATLEDTVDPIEPLLVYLGRGADVQDVSAMFAYSPWDNALSLKPEAADAFRGLLADTLMTLMIGGGDSVGNSVDVSVPLINGRFQILGTTSFLSGDPEALDGTQVMLWDLKGGYSAATTLAGDGTFGFDNLPGGSYTMMINTAGGLLGTAFLQLDRDAPDTVSVSVPLFGAEANLAVAASLAAADLSGATDTGPLIAHMPQGLSVASSATMTPLGGVGANPLSPLGQATFTLPIGTKVLSLHASAWSHVLTELYFDAPGHPCAPRYEGLRPADTPFSFFALLNGRVIAKGGGTHCGLPVDDSGFTAGASLLDLNLDVAHLTVDREAQLRLVAAAGGGGGDAFADIGLSAAIGVEFTITKVSDQAAGVPLVLSELRCPGETATRKFLGVPTGGRETFNKWRLTIEYSPEEAQIQSLRVLARSPGTPVQELALVQPAPAANGVIQVKDVGFPATPDPRPMWDLKASDAVVEVELEALMPDGLAVTKREPLGKDVTLARAGSRLTPLYDAGEMPGASARRFGLRDDEIGGDGWSTRETYAFLEANTDLVFNDVSREQGGLFPQHRVHRCGLSVDTRYLGSGGQTDPLNGREGDESAAARLTVLRHAQNGDLTAQQRIVRWIKENRRRMDLLFANDTIDRILVGRIPWNFNSLVNGVYENGAAILDPDNNNQPIGAWTPLGTVLPWPEHLSHIHIERLPAPRIQ